LILSCGFPPTASTHRSSMKPSSFSTLAIASFVLEEGQLVSL
jgi:hypothetical protein